MKNSSTVKRIKEQDLVLKVSDDVNPKVWDESNFYKFADELSGNREYQKEAIFTALRFMCSGNYNNTNELAFNSFHQNEKLAEKYTTFENLKNSLYFGDSYTATLDLATGTGKSWVLYGIASIMLATNKIDQVLVLVPSVTIEEELTNKFRTFAIDEKLNNLLNSIPPKIINGSESITKGCICIENRDAIYNNTRSSIIDSLLGKGNRTLILSDEVHHLYYSEENKWKEFINKIKFKYNIGVSGTCYYSDNNYFSNVIYRYSLRQAIEDNRVKSVEYVSESNVPTKAEDRWKVIINSHNEIKNRIKTLPLTLVVTANITSCKKTANEFKRLYRDEYNLTEEEVEEKVLIIHSGNDSAADRIRLKSVDNLDSKVEWIFSVSMLTEGWDVKRVYQIVPHEERAFNSKLLIAQVLGRGLRIPINWDYQQNGTPKVIIFNHAKWASSVKKLVDEVLEIEKKISNSINNDSEFHFELTNINYKPDKTVIKTKKENSYNLFEKGFVVLPSDSADETIETTFTEVDSNKNRAWNTTISHKTYSVEQMALIMWSRFEDVPDDNNKGLSKKYQEEWNVEKLKKMIKLSLQKSGNIKITEKLKQKFLSSMGVIFRQCSTVVGYKTKPDKYETITTKLLRKDGVSASSLSKDKTLFWTNESIKYLTDEEKEFFKEIIDTTNSYKQMKVENFYDFKTPQTMVIADSDPEKEFIKKLVNHDNNTNITSWIKSNSTGFYSIEYSWRKGEHAKRGMFNPDFFIVYLNRVIVVEIKGDEQIENVDLENIGKFKAARDHFEIINKYLKNKSELKYKFTMLTPCSFETFFNKLKSKNVKEIDSFVSDLDATIKEIIE